MSSDREFEQLVEALQQDGPSERDAARLRARMSALGIATATVVGQGTAAASMPVAKAAGSVATSFTTRWAGLTFLPKMGIVAAVSAAAVAGPVYATRALERAPAAETSTRASSPARKPTRPVVAATSPGANATAAAAATTNATASNATPSVTEPTAAQIAPDDERVVRHDVAASSVARTVVANAKVAPQASLHGAAVTTGAASGESRAAGVSGESTVAAAIEPAAPGPDTVGVARFAENGSTAEAPRPAPPGSTLAEETALVDAALAAVRAGDSTNAAALIAEHARRFPHGLLWRERERARAKLADFLAGQSPR